MTKVDPARHGKRNLFGLSPDDLAEILDSYGQPPFRGRQLARWIYHQRITDFSAMSNLGSPLCDRLAENFVITRPAPKNTQHSSDGTRKFVFELGDGKVESVLLFDADRRTLCVSSQIGCPMGCRFCATGGMGFRRNLTPGEIIGQVLAAEDFLSPLAGVTNIVFMGMGEPLLNFDSMVGAIKIICSELGPSISQKKITISTVGLAAQITKLADSDLKTGLAISLFSADHLTRGLLIPTHKKLTLNELHNAAEYYTQKTGRRVTFEIVLIKDVNDSLEQAKKLVSFIHGIPCKINLIRFHPFPGSKFAKPDEERVLAFRDYLYPRAPAVTIRKSFGEDIAAACGQLAARL